MIPNNNILVSNRYVFNVVNKFANPYFISKSEGNSENAVKVTC
jgi:hypothetical protein